MKKDKDIIDMTLDGEPIAATISDDDLKAVRDKFTEMLPAKKKKDALKMLQGIETKDDLVKQADDIATAALAMAVHEMVDILSQSRPRVDGLGEADPNNEQPAANLDPNQLRALAAHNYTITQAFKAVSDFVSKRQKTQEMYAPHVYKGGKRYPIPIAPKEWEIIDGECHYRPTHLRWKNKYEQQQNKFHALLKRRENMSAGGNGICHANESNPGCCVFQERAPEPKKTDGKEEKTSFIGRGFNMDDFEPEIDGEN